MHVGYGRNHRHSCLPLLPAHEVLEQLAGRQLAQHLPVAIGEDGIGIPGHPTWEESEVNGQRGTLGQGNRQAAVTRSL